MSSFPLSPETLKCLGKAVGYVGLAIGAFMTGKYFKKNNCKKICGKCCHPEDFIVISPEVSKALKEHKPVVALESTIITHGMKYPNNVETAKAVEEVIREHGAVPATIAILDGQPLVGVTEEQLEKLGKMGFDAEKVSIRDIGDCMSRKLTGGTTVATTMYLASLAGIKVFATGGIGGVHRGASETFDISCDLQTFSHVPVAVVCAGPKAILDVPATAEYLETFGVPVVGYKTDVMPCFYSRTMQPEIKLYSVGKDAEDIAKKFHYMNLITPSLGMLVVNPVKEEDEFKFDEIGPIIDNALEDAKEHEITGKNITPYLLKTIAEKTGDKSLDTNIKLVKNNARVAAKIAVELNEMAKKH